jgi:ParB family chromosome partitioning protein
MPTLTLQLRDLAALDGPAPSRDGQPMTVAIELIDEDPEQPRTDFDLESLRELAATIAERGVCQPVSIRVHAALPDRYMLNFGARRLRAARLAGKSEIPAFVAERDDGYAQVIENEQREALKPLELARFVEKRLHAGESLSEVARRLGKSRTYLTFVSALIDAPEWLLDLYRSGKCRGTTELYELRRLHDTAPDAVTQWASSRAAISRLDVQLLKAQRLSTAGDGAPVAEDGRSGEIGGDAAPTSVSGDRSTMSRRRVAKPFVLEADLHGAVVYIDLSAAPDQDGQVFVLEKEGRRRPVGATDLRLLRVVARSA